MSAAGNRTRGRVKLASALLRLVAEHGVPGRFFVRDVARAAGCSEFSASGLMRRYGRGTLDAPGYRGAIEVSYQVDVLQLGQGSKGLRRRAVLVLAESVSCRADGAA